MGCYEPKTQAWEAGHFFHQMTVRIAMSAQKIISLHFWECKIFGYNKFRALCESITKEFGWSKIGQSQILQWTSAVKFSCCTWNFPWQIDLLERRHKLTSTPSWFNSFAFCCGIISSLKFNNKLPFLGSLMEIIHYEIATITQSICRAVIGNFTGQLNESHEREDLQLHELFLWNKFPNTVLWNLINIYL